MGLMGLMSLMGDEPYGPYEPYETYETKKHKIHKSSLLQAQKKVGSRYFHENPVWIALEKVVGWLDNRAE